MQLLLGMGSDLQYDWYTQWIGKNCPLFSQLVPINCTELPGKCWDLCLLSFSVLGYCLVWAQASLMYVYHQNSSSYMCCFMPMLSFSNLTWCFKNYDWKRLFPWITHLALTIFLSSHMHKFLKLEKFDKDITFRGSWAIGLAFIINITALSTGFWRHRQGLHWLDKELSSRSHSWKSHSLGHNPWGTSPACGTFITASLVGQ